MEAVWKPLKATGAPQSCPPLFAKSQFTSNSYVVFLTDLRHIWEENMDRKSIFKRALLEETPIDPTEDAAQTRLLLDHIRNAIEGRAGTRRQLIKNMDDPQALSLHLTASLPGSLGDLEWMMYCKRLPSASLQHHLISPLISMAHDHMQQVDDLIARLGAKDHVITKLLDRLEGSGTDITSVFPGATGARGSKHLTLREQAARQVQGLGPFDPKQWRQSHSGRQNTRVSDASLPRVLGAITSTEDVDGEINTDDLWVSALPSTVSDSVEDVGDTFIAGSRGGNAPKKDGTELAEEDEFERQDTPPRLQKFKESQNLAKMDLATSLHHSYDSEETTDDEDLDAPSSQRPAAHKPASLSAPSTSLSPKRQSSVLSPNRKRLGKLGGRISDPPDRKPVGSNTAADEESTTSETEEEDGTEVAKVPDPEPAVHTGTSGTEKPAAAPHRKGKLGVLGGKKQPISTNGSASSTPPPATASVPSGVHSRNRSADVSSDDVGVVKKSTAERWQSPNASVGRTTSEGRTTSTPFPSAAPDSEQERADRKREELKRQLEKAQGPKKKRKF